ncbi:hypothetical protein BaRGS_00012733 [Batillaria attramentaria]|uniref:Uncharacterized protein n=1 Tax=Batillaria attramentaria TaxID=370345 RepID=A0ABD0LA76_9CAEN
MEEENGERECSNDQVCRREARYGGSEDGDYSAVKGQITSASRSNGINIAFWSPNRDYVPLITELQAAMLLGSMAERETHTKERNGRNASSSGRRQTPGKVGIVISRSWRKIRLPPFPYSAAGNLSIFYVNRWRWRSREIFPTALSAIIYTLPRCHTDPLGDPVAYGRHMK